MIPIFLLSNNYCLSSQRFPPLLPLHTAVLHSYSSTYTPQRATPIRRCLFAPFCVTAFAATAKTATKRKQTSLGRQTTSSSSAPAAAQQLAPAPALPCAVNPTPVHRQSTDRQPVSDRLLVGLSCPGPLSSLPPFLRLPVTSTTSSFYPAKPYCRLTPTSCPLDRLPPHPSLCPSLLASVGKSFFVSCVFIHFGR